MNTHCGEIFAVAGKGQKILKKKNKRKRRIGQGFGVGEEPFLSFMMSATCSVLKNYLGSYTQGLGCRFQPHMSFCI